MYPPRFYNKGGFTLIELSIVLVIIGLIIGGILIGRDLIAASAMRATITQIQQYNAAANTFKSKYGFLPGDIPDPYASEIGLKARGTVTGEGDGDGSLQGNWDNAAGGNNGSEFVMGETAMFWVDLSTTQLIAESFTIASPNSYASRSVTNIGTYFPQAKLGMGNYIFAYGGGLWGGSIVDFESDGYNYFGIAAVTAMYAGNGLNNAAGTSEAAGAIPVWEAAAIDTKLDDGYPLSGNVQAKWQVVYQPNSWAESMWTLSNCINFGTAPNSYNTTNSTGVCGLSIKFQ